MLLGIINHKLQFYWRGDGILMNTNLIVGAIIFIIIISIQLTLNLILKELREIKHFLNRK
jgi:hypothetical protein